MDDGSPAARRPRGAVREIVLLFLKLGTIAFGGPVAHIALMRDEVVRRRGWVSDQRFVDLIGAVNLIPGPNSTELAIHLGWDRARWRGLLAAGTFFILPAALIVTALAWAYVTYGDTPAVAGILYGVVPVVIGIVAHALVGLLRTVITGVGPALLAAAALAAYLLGVNELLILAAGAALAAGARAARRQPRGGGRALLAPFLLPVGPPLLGALASPAAGLSSAAGGHTLGQLFLTMLKIGSVLYGSGYVLLAFLRGDFVQRLGWLTEQQLLDAVSIGQITPGPVFTTATFVGYVVAGPLGALLAAVAIFLPSFVLVGLLTRITNRLRSSPWTSALLDGVNAAALALMAGVTLQLGRAAIIDPLTAVLAAASLLVLWRTRLNSAWLIGGGALVGLGHVLLG